MRLVQKHKHCKECKDYIDNNGSNEWHKYDINPSYKGVCDKCESVNKLYSYNV